jgi:putative flippase GtrA
VRFLRYAFVGAMGTAAHYAVLVVLVQAAGIDPVLGSTVGAVVGAVVNYFLNHRYTFASRRRHAHAMPRFAATAIVGMLVNAAMLAALINGFGAHYLVAQVVATLVVVGLTYATNHAWTF